MVGVAAGLIQTNLIGPGQDSVQVTSKLGGDQVNGAVDNDALGTVDGDDVALVQYAIATLDTHDLLGRVDMEALDTADAGRTHAAGDNGGMARLATVARQDALGGNHALQVVRVGLPTDQDDLVALGGTRDASSLENTTSPTAAPGLALRPVASASYFLEASNCGCRS